MRYIKRNRQPPLGPLGSPNPMRTRHPSLSRMNSSYSMQSHHTPRQMDSPSYPPRRPSQPSEETSGESSEELSEDEHGDPDKSEALFTMYLERSDEDDRKTTERWNGECNAILTFTGLFAAALAALLSISIQGLQRSSQDTSAFYLGNIYHLLAGTASSQPTVHPTLSDPPKFSPPTSAVLVNSLWFLSLLMSLTGALLAVFIQQWAQSYLQATQKRHHPHRRARIRAFHKRGLEKLRLHRVTRTLPILIHVSLFLFFAGLPIFLFNVNRTVFNVVVAWLAVCVAGYACITLMPIFYQDSPYYSPLSSSIWWCFINALFILYRLFKNVIPHKSFVLRWYDAHYAKSHFHWPSLRAMQKAAGRYARKLPPKIDYHALLRMFKTLNEDDEFEQFFDALPSLCDSKRLKDVQKDFIQPNKKMLSHALIGMMDRTLLSDLVPEEVKQRRIIIFTKVIGAASILEPRWILRRVLFGEWIRFSRSIHFGLFVQDWKNISDPVTAFYAQYVVAITLASMQQRDDHWFELASGQLNESKSFLRSYYANGDSVLLANAIFIIRRTIQTFSKSENHQQKEIDEVPSKLELLCRFDIHNTLTEHQHVFCSFWNQLVDAAQNNTYPGVSQLCVMMLKSIRRLYVTLHGNPSTVRDSPSMLHENPSSPASTVQVEEHLSASTPYRNAVLGDARLYTKCKISEHRHITRVPDLPLDGLPTEVTMDEICLLTSELVPVMPATYSTTNPVIPSPVALGLSPTAIPTVASHPNPVSSHHPVPLVAYPLVPDPDSRPAAPTPPSVFPFVPIPQVASSRTRRRPDITVSVPPVSLFSQRSSSETDEDYAVASSPTTMAEANSRMGGHVFHAQSPFTPEVSHRRRVGFVGVSSASTSRSSSLVVLARQEPPDIRADDDTPAPAAWTPFIPPKAVRPETPFLPPLPSPRPVSVPQGLPVVTNAALKKKSKKNKKKAPTPTKSPVVPSPPSRDGAVQFIPPDLGPSRGSLEIYSKVHQPVPVSPHGTGIPVQGPLDTDFTTDVSFAAAPSASSSPVPFTTKRGSSAQIPSAMPSVIEVDEYGEFSGVLHYSLHRVLYEDRLYPTAVHLFEALKYLPHRPDLADRIRQCECVQQVASISAELANFVRRDWGNIMLSMMDEVLCLKFRQHRDLRTLLLNTYPADLVYVEAGDPFWAGDAGAGMNELGKSLMRVRERLRFEGGM